MDAYHYYGGDLYANDQGDLLLTDGITLSQQRILRRLLTNPGDYIWHPTYGAGVPSYIGQSLTNALYNKIQSIITSQMYLESSVAQNPPPIIVLNANQNTLSANITYTQNPSQTLQILSFTVSA